MVLRKLVRHVEKILDSQLQSMNKNKYQIVQRPKHECWNVRTFTGKKYIECYLLKDQKLNHKKQGQ